MRLPPESHGERAAPEEGRGTKLSKPESRPRRRRRGAASHGGGLGKIERALRHSARREELLQETETALVESRNLLRSIIDNMPHLIHVFDPAGRFLVANKAVADSLGVTTAELVGKRRAELMPADIAERYEASDRVAIAAGKPIQFEEKGQFHGRQAIFLTTKFPLHDARGEIYAVAAISTDITERKQAEDVLRRDTVVFGGLVEEKTRALVAAGMELEKAKRLSDIGTLAATVAHELRNPLAAIATAAENVRRKAKNEDLSKHLGNIHKKVIESNDIINNLLSFARIRSPQYETVDICATVKQGLAMKTTASGKRVTMKIREGARKRLLIQADPLQMAEVVSNILSNALDAVSEPDGRVDIKIKEDGDFARVSVRDNGEGIAGEDLARIFDPFFTTKAKGTGLGLPVCRQIVGLHSGSIEVWSEAGQGTLVTVRLPKSRPL